MTQARGSTEAGDVVALDVAEGTARGRSSQLTANWTPGEFALRDTWFPVAHLRLVGRRPLRRGMHGQPVYLHRVDGRIVATENHPRDVERGRVTLTEFSAGTGTYALVERYGYAWVWFGDPANASPDLIPDVPYLRRDGGYGRGRVGCVVFDSTYELINENLLDLTHADFVHSKIVGDSLSENDEITVESTSETVTMIRTATGRRTPAAQRLLVRSERQDLRAVTHVHVRSGVCVLHGDFMPGLSVRLFHPNVPESPTRTRTNFTFDTHRGSRFLRESFPLLAHLVGYQDNRVVKPQNPAYRGAEDEPRADMSSRFDAAGMRYRKVHQELVRRQLDGDTSYLADGDPGRDVSELLGVDRVS